MQYVVHIARHVHKLRYVVVIELEVLQLEQMFDVLQVARNEVVHTHQSKETAEDVAYIMAKEASSNIGKMAAVSGQVYGSRDNGSFYLVNVGAAYPNQQLTVALRGETKKLWTDFDGKTIRVSGKITEYKGKPQIEVSNLYMINLIHIVGVSDRMGG